MAFVYGGDKVLRTSVPIRQQCALTSQVSSVLHRNRLGGGAGYKAHIKLRSPSIPMVLRWFEHCFEELNALSGVIEIPEEIMAV